MQETPEQSTTENTNDVSTSNSLFSQGNFVIGLIVVGLFVALITWSVSFTALFFGAIGSFLSLASACLNHGKFGFQEKNTCQCKDENWAYFAMRALAGSVFGTAIALLAFTDLSHVAWASIAVVSMAGAFILDQLVFKRNTPTH